MGLPITYVITTDTFKGAPDKSGTEDPVSLCVFRANDTYLLCIPHGQVHYNPGFVIILIGFPKASNTTT